MADIIRDREMCSAVQGDLSMIIAREGDFGRGSERRALKHQKSSQGVQMARSAEHLPQKEGGRMKNFIEGDLRSKWEKKGLRRCSFTDIRYAQMPIKIGFFVVCTVGRTWQSAKTTTLRNVKYFKIGG